MTRKFEFQLLWKKIMPVSVLLLTHDNVGNALLSTVEKTLGALPLPTIAVPISHDCDPGNLISKLKCIIRTVEKGSGILILTDLFGATPCNIARALQDEAVRVVTGINLPMLIRVMNYPKLSLLELAKKAMSGGKEGVLDCCPTTIETASPYFPMLRKINIFRRLRMISNTV